MTRFTPRTQRLALRARVFVRRRPGEGAEPGLALSQLCCELRGVCLLARLEAEQGVELYLFDAPDAELVRDMLRCARPGESFEIWSEPAPDGRA